MHRRVVPVLSGLLVVGMLAGGASAAPVTIRDTIGDANAVNGQGLVPGSPGENTATPGSQASYDIASVTLSSTFIGKGKRRAPKDLVVKLELAGEPLRSGVTYFVETGKIGDCETGITFEFSAPRDGGWTSQIRTCPTGGVDLYYAVPLQIPTFGKKTVTWTVPYEKLTSISTAKMRVGDALPELGAAVHFDSVAFNFPVMDTLASNVSYKLGS